MSARAAGTTAVSTAAPGRRSGTLRVAIADYGAGNLRSVTSALARAGASAVVTVDPEVVDAAPLAVIAGVGHVESAARGLAAHGLDAAVRERAGRGAPTFGICVGMQLLFEESEEGGRGLGLLTGAVRRLRARRVPHMGWNTLVTNGHATLAGLEGAEVYFAHSFAADADASVVTATTDHDGPVVAAVAAGPVAGVQFHPERSGAAGARLLENVLAWSRSV